MRPHPNRFSARCGNRALHAHTPKQTPYLQAVSVANNGAPLCNSDSTGASTLTHNTASLPFLVFGYFPSLRFVIQKVVSSSAALLLLFIDVVSGLGGGAVAPSGWQEAGPTYTNNAALLARCGHTNSSSGKSKVPFSYTVGVISLIS